MKLISKLEKSISFWFILATSFVFFLFRWPSLFEPYWYGDEGIYQAVGMLLSSGAPLYSGAWENKPPLLLFLYALLSSDQFLIRIASLIFGLISIWFFYLIALRLFPQAKKSVAIVTIIFTFLFGTNFIEGNIANAENFMLLPTLISFYLLISHDTIKKAMQFKTLLLAGFILSIAFLTKVVVIFDFLAFISFLLFAPGILKEKLNQKILPFVLGFTLPVLITFFYYLITSNFKEFMNAFLLRNVGYVGFENDFLIPQGFLILKSLILGIFLLFMYLQRKTFSKYSLLIVIWFAFSLFNIYFSGRPYTHYLLLLLPSFCLMIGVVLNQKKERIFALLFIIVALFFIKGSFLLKPEKIIPYYSNLISFCMDKKSLSQYLSFFDRRTPKDYLLANYIKTNTEQNDKIFIWGNNAQVYKLSNKTPVFRYTVVYHVISYDPNFQEMERVLNIQKPEYIIAMPDVMPFPLTLTNYIEKARLQDIVIYEKIF